MWFSFNIYISNIVNILSKKKIRKFKLNIHNHILHNFLQERRCVLLSCILKHLFFFKRSIYHYKFISYIVAYRNISFYFFTSSILNIYKYVEFK